MCGVDAGTCFIYWNLFVMKLPVSWFKAATVMYAACIRQYHIGVVSLLAQTLCSSAGLAGLQPVHGRGSKSEQLHKKPRVMTRLDLFFV